MQLVLKRAVANLLEDVGIPGLVDLGGFAALGADDFMHGYAFCFCRLLAASGLYRVATPQQSCQE